MVGLKAGLWHDRATGEGGDFIALLRAKFGFGFKEAVEWIERTLGISLQSWEADKRKIQTVRQPEPELPDLRPDELRRMAQAAHRLATNPELFSTVFGSRPEISLEAVHGAALDGDLGFEPDCRFGTLFGPVLLFGYSHGIKARWSTDLLGERYIRWLAGKPGGECWRQSLLRRGSHAHRRVYITEGETDALSVLSLGLEDEDEHSLVVALPGANILPEPGPFMRLEVVIVPDPDDAGRRAAEKLTVLLGPVVRGITVLEGGL